MGYIYVNGRRVEVHESADYQDGVFIGTILRYLFIAAWWVLKVATCGIVILVVWIYRKIKAKVDQANAEKYGHLRCLTKWVADTVDGKPCVTFTSTLSNNGDKDIAQMDGRIILSEGGNRKYTMPFKAIQISQQGKTDYAARFWINESEIAGLPTRVFTVGFLIDKLVYAK